MRGVHAGEHRAVKLRDAKNEGVNSGREKTLSRLAPSGIRVVIFVSRAFRSTDLEKKRDCS